MSVLYPILINIVVDITIFIGYCFFGTVLSSLLSRPLLQCTDLHATGPDKKPW